MNDNQSFLAADKSKPLPSSIRSVKVVRRKDYSAFLRGEYGGLIREKCVVVICRKKPAQ